MKSFFALSLASILVVVTVLFATDKGQGVRWEYAVIEMPYNTVTKKGPYRTEREPLIYEASLNELGSQGWELVSSFKQYADGARIKEYYIFKKKV